MGWIMFPKNSHDEILNSDTLECDLTWKQGYCTYTGVPQRYCGFSSRLPQKSKSQSFFMMEGLAFNL